MSEFTWQPAPGFVEQSTPRILLAQFGDGYSAAAPDGLNALDQRWSLHFAGVAATMLEIDTFLRSKGGATSFTWTPYGGSEVRVVCLSWSLKRTTRNVYELDAEFVRVYR